MPVGEAFLSAFLQVVFDRLASGDLLEFARLWKVDAPLKKLRITSSKISAVLSDADEKQISDMALKIWMDELKHVMYDAEDIIDEFATEALRWEMEAESQSSKTQVRSLISSSLKPSVVLFNVGIESKIKGVTDRLDDVVKQRFELGLRENGGGRNYSRIWERVPTTSLVLEPLVYGRERDVEDVIEVLLSDERSNEVCVIPIVGMFGVGKTTLAQMVYNDRRVEKHFDLKVWVWVSEDFDVMRITRAILESVNSAAFYFNDLDMLQVRLKEAVAGKKLLLVLDDVWSKKYNVWVLVRNPLKLGAKGSKIIVMTRDETVASVFGTMPAHRLMLLSDEDCWLLFAQHSFGNKMPHTHPDIQMVRKTIEHKCKCLPLVAKTLGGLMHVKLGNQEWEDVLSSKLWDLANDETELLMSLRISYQFLPVHLKRCFAYYSLFPKDYEFNKDTLILLWMAEGFLQESKGRRMEEVGAEYFQDLLLRSFFQRANGSESRFVMHDVINYLAQFVSGETCSRLENLLAANEQYRIFENVRHFSYTRGRRDAFHKFYALCNATSLRTFLPLDLMGKKWNQLPD